MKKVLALGLIQISFCVNFFEIANTTSLFSNDDIADLVLPEFNLFPSACNFIGKFEYGKLNHNVTKIGIPIKTTSDRPSSKSVSILDNFPLAGLIWVFY